MRRSLIVIIAIGLAVVLGLGLLVRQYAIDRRKEARLAAQIRAATKIPPLFPSGRRRAPKPSKVSVTVKAPPLSETEITAYEFIRVDGTKEAALALARRLGMVNPTADEWDRSAPSEKPPIGVRSDAAELDYFRETGQFQWSQQTRESRWFLQGYVQETLSGKKAASEEAAKISQRFLKTRGLLPRGYRLEQVLVIGMAGSGVERQTEPLAWRVVFARRIGGRRVRPSDRIIVRVVAGGEVQSVEYYHRPVRPYAKLALKTIDEVIEELKSGNGPRISPKATRATIETVEIYYDGNGPVNDPSFYLVPAYEIHGTAYLGAKAEPFETRVEAFRRD